MSGEVTSAVSGMLSQGLLDKVTTYAVGFGVFLRVVGIIRVAKDSTARTNSFGLQLVSILLATLFGPVFGILLYIAIRPVTYKIERSAWREAMLAMTIECLHCGHHNDKDAKACVSCGCELTTKCRQCHKDFPVAHEFCQHCGAPNPEL